jgi:hypothetical protein
MLYRIHLQCGEVTIIGTSLLKGNGVPVHVNLTNLSMSLTTESYVAVRIVR